jgi:hypothetical protein
MSSATGKGLLYTDNGFWQAGKSGKLSLDLRFKDLSLG